MNCPKCRSRMEYRPEHSNPRARRLSFWCEKCRAFRFVFEFPSKDILTILLDSIELSNILPTRFKNEVKQTIAI